MPTEPSSSTTLSDSDASLDFTGDVLFAKGVSFDACGTIERHHQRVAEECAQLIGAVKDVKLSSTPHDTADDAKALVSMKNGLGSLAL
jgi:hypothetical protein